MKLCKTTLLLLLFLLLTTTSAFAATVSLFDWAFNQNGAFLEAADPLPSDLDGSAFDWSTGFGTLSVSHTAATAETYSFITFLDHEIDQTTNTYYNEYGGITGNLPAGQSIEIDEPGYTFGDIYDHVEAGSLDNTNTVPSAGADDVSMAIGWDFALAAGDRLLIDFVVSDIAPVSGFYLSQTDPDSVYTLYFSSTATITAIPEPGTLLLLGAGLAGLLVGRKYLP